MAPGAELLPRKSWGELYSEVRNIRRKFATIGPRYPHSFTFRKMVKNTRIYFMSSCPDSRENSIFAIDLHENNSIVHRSSIVDGDSFTLLDNSSYLSWIKVISHSFMFSSGFGPTKEEQLIMERKRMNPKGISEYAFDKSSGKFLISTGSTLYEAIDDQSILNPSNPPTEIISYTVGPRLNAEFCPTNSNLIAFVNNKDIWVVNTQSSHEVRLTFTQTTNIDESVDDTKSAGFPTYVMQEEFNRFTGYWWQVAVDDGIYRILYEENDEKDVDLVKLLSLPNKDPELYRFPMAGTKNSTSTFKIIEFTLDSEGQIHVLKDEGFVCPIQELFPSTEYVVRAGWVPDGKFVWFQLLDRKQQKLELVLYPIIKKDHSPSAPLYVIYSESRNFWINVHDMLTFIPSDSPDSVSFLWASEETGYKHLYLIKSELRPALEQPWNTSIASTPLLCLSPNILSKTPLTFGDWEVCNEIVRVKLPELVVFFTAVADTPMEKHLYAVYISQPGIIRRLTTLGHSYTCVINSSCNLIIANYSSIREPPICKIFKIKYQGSNIDGVSIEPLTVLLKAQEINMNFSIPEILTYRLETGEDLYGMIFKPLNFDPCKKYPAILHVYGGPEVQMIQNTFRGSGQLWIHLVTSLGYVVISIDSRGSAHRGVEFEAHIKNRMGTVELKDQVEMLSWLVKENSYIDQSRIGIYGWSYGGYLALLGLAFYPEIFKISIAGAPVVNWEFYDTGYTERYMDIPEDNPIGYKEGSVLTYIDRFPDTEQRLLIIQGMVDENVHAVHSFSLIDALIKANKPYELQVYPTERHSLRKLESSEHFETTFLSFLQRAL